MTTNNAIAQRNTKIIKALEESKGIIIDGHCPKRSKTKLAGIAIQTNGDRQVVVGLFKAAYFSVNQLTLNNDGEAMISTISVGGVVDCRGRSLEDAIELYNKQQNEDVLFKTGTLEEIVYF